MTAPGDGDIERLRLQLVDRVKQHLVKSGDCYFPQVFFLVFNSPVFQVMAVSISHLFIGNRREAALIYADLTARYPQAVAIFSFFTTRRGTFLSADVSTDAGRAAARATLLADTTGAVSIHYIDCRQLLPTGCQEVFFTDFTVAAGQFCFEPERAVCPPYTDDLNR